MTRPNSRQGAIFFINLASDVPPVVEKTGLILVIFFIIFFANWVVAPGWVRKESPVTKKSILYFVLFFLQIDWIIEVILFFKLGKIGVAVVLRSQYRDQLKLCEGKLNQIIKQKKIKKIKKINN